MDMLKSPVIPHHGPTFAVISKDMQSLNLKVMWGNCLRVVGITPSFITGIMYVKSSLSGVTTAYVR